MTTTWIALLRGINVGRAKRIPMGDLRGVLQGLGYDDVRTHLQSGNAVLTTAKGSEASLEKAIRTGIADDLGVDCAVLVRSSVELQKVVAGNPFVKRKVPVSELHATFLSKRPSASKLAAVDAEAAAPDEVEVGDRVLYTRLPNGVTGSKLPSWDRFLGVDATARSWKTVLRLLELAGEPPS